MSSQREAGRAERLERAIRLKRAAARSRGSELPARPAEEMPYVSELQRSLWLTQQMDPSSPAYHLVSAWRPSGPLDLSRLEHSLERVVSRHRILRSTFRAQREGILQVVSPHIDLGIESYVVADGEVRRAARREARKSFDLATGPLIRMVYVSDRSQREMMLLLVMHHILADERSLGYFWRQLVEAYEERETVPVPAVQFDDFVYWAAEQGIRDRGRELEYWRGRLDPLPEELILPFETANRDRGGPHGRLLRKTLGSELQEETRRLAAAVGATPFMVFAFVFRLLLERYASGQQVAFATPVSVRSHPAAAEMIGYFLNPVVIYAAIDERSPVQEALTAFAREIKEVLSHASVPFDVLAEELSPPRRADRHPIFQVMFVHQEASAALELGSVGLEPVELDLGESKFDLTLFVCEGPSSLELAAEYRADRFDESWIDSLLGHYETLLTGLARDLRRPIAEVSMLSRPERLRLASWRGTVAKPQEATLVAQQILAGARQVPDALALSCGGLRWSYAELAQSASGIAHTLMALGVEPGDRVGLFLERSPLMIAGVLGCHWAGAAYVPLDPGYPSTRNREVLEDALVSAVLTTSSLDARLPAGSWSTIRVDRLETVDWESLELPPPMPEAPAYVLYTSGSTGRPKGVIVSHENLQASTEARRRVYDLPPRRFLLLPSVAFDSSVAGIFWTLSARGTLVIPTEGEIKDAWRLAQIVDEEQVDSLLCVPSLYRAMLQADPDRLRGLETAIVAGEACTSPLVQEHFRALPQVRLFNEYGPTEATVWATVHEVSPSDAQGPVPIGRPIPGVQVRVLDGLGRDLPAGVPGSAWIVGPTVARGYWRRAELSEERFGIQTDGAEAGFRRYRTGDLMSWTADGNLLFRGREDDQIKLRGYRIEPGEIEAALRERPEVEDVAVVARPLGSADAGIAATDGPKHLVAFLRTATYVDESSLRDQLEDRLPEFMLPQRFVQLAELPRLANGKIDRGRLHRMILKGERAAEGQIAPANEREQALVALWEGLLGRSGIGVTENFFELGGHSLLVVEMTNAIDRDHGARLTAAEVFQNPTVRQLAAHIERQQEPDRASYAHLFPIQPGGRGVPLIVAIPHVFTEMLATRFRGERPVYGLRGVGLRPEGNRGRWPTMRHLAEELVEEIRRRFPDDPYILAGYSFGATMAVETVRLMEERGIGVQCLYLIAPMPLNFCSVGPFRVQIDGLRQPVEELTFSQVSSLLVRENHPLTRRPYDRAWRLLAIQPWRHFLCLVGRLRRLLGLPLTPRILHADVRIERFRLHRLYRPGIVRAPTVIFNPREAEADVAATWRPHFRGPLTVCETPDPHLGEVAIEQAKELILRQLEDLEDR